MKKLLFILLIALVSFPALGAFTKTRTQVDEWAEVAQNSFREGAVIDISGSYSTGVTVSWAVTTETAHTGTGMEIQVSMNTSGDEDWATLISPQFGVGTAASEVTSGTETPGATVIECASTTGFVADEIRWIFFEHTTPANSELAKLVSAVTNTSVTVMDGITNDQTAGTMFNLAGTATYSIPMFYNRMRVVIDNTVDPDGSTVHTKTEVLTIPSLS